MSQSFGRLVAGLARNFRHISDDDLRRIESIPDAAAVPQATFKAVNETVPQSADPASYDQWESRTRGGLSTERLAPLGQPEAASGNGASKMIRQYSQPADQSELVRAYAALSERMLGLEKAVSALTTFVASKAGADSFPSDSRGNNGGPARKEVAKEDDKEDDDDELEKAMRSGTLPVMSVPQFLGRLANRSRHPGLAIPPTFIKAGDGSQADPLDDPALSVTDAINAASAKNRMLMLAAIGGNPSAAANVNARLSADARRAAGLN